MDPSVNDKSFYLTKCRRRQIDHTTSIHWRSFSRALRLDDLESVERAGCELVDDSSFLKQTRYIHCPLRHLRIAEVDHQHNQIILLKDQISTIAHLHPQTILHQLQMSSQGLAVFFVQRSFTRVKSEKVLNECEISGGCIWIPPNTIVPLMNRLSVADFHALGL